MTSGGKRIGSGRPAKLDFTSRLLIGSNCLAKYRALVDQKIAATTEHLMNNELNDVRKLQQEAASVAPEKRGEWLESTYSQEGYVLREDADFARQTHAGIEPDATDAAVPMMVRINVARPYGVWDTIIEEVVAEAQAQYPNTRITPRFVKTCLKEARAFLKESCHLFV